MKGHFEGELIVPGPVMPGVYVRVDVTRARRLLGPADWHRARHVGEIVPVRISYRFHPWCPVAWNCPLCARWPDLRAGFEFRRRSLGWFTRGGNS